MTILPKFMRQPAKPLPSPDVGVGGNAPLQLFQYFPKFAMIGNGTANRGQFAVTAPAPPITLGARVTVPAQAVVSGLGGLQNGNIAQTPLYNTQTRQVGRKGL